MADNSPHNVVVNRTAALSKVLAAVVDTCPGALGLKHSMNGNCQGAFLRYIDNRGMDDLIHSCKSLVHGVVRGKSWLVLLAEVDTCCLAWKCLEKTQDGCGTWGSWLHVLSQDKGEECSGVVAVIADDGPQGGVLADQTAGLLPQHLE